MQKFVLGALLSLMALAIYSLVDIITSSGDKNEPVQASVPEQNETMPLHALPEKALSVTEKKRRFIQSILPAVQNVKQELDAEYVKARSLIAKKERSAEEKAWLRVQMQRYNVSGYPCLLRCMHTHPSSLVVAQAALETGWGSSRFFNEANNVFGIWSYNKHEPRIAASEQRSGKTIYVKKYASLDDAIRSYFRMIAKGYAYSGFRKARMQTDNPFELLRHLRHYSELRDEYVARLYYVIKANRLYKYDAPSHAPIALSEIIPQYVAQKREAAEKRKLQEQQMVALNEVKVEKELSEDEPVLPCDEEDIILQTSEPLPLPPEG